ncbi:MULTISPECIES: OpgC domain-containing protein [unclassified Variovorax]|uniref:OpgC domain-containing protein n=1 Tax=unclassified Variovorax TaxID=663243 RepID=UPI0025770FDC|nr:MULTISPECIES: OpgC domain-containing protein [unclassified Variovorax]MDM0090363.1 OpgC domain-containing protein [Variovorax sp. J22G40]MDM0147972.1 OpgC domain-containing protein [Variovorax sp. J2P1-31]
MVPIHAQGAPSVRPASPRYWEVDALRGLMLVLMTLTHLPSRLTDPLGQPFGFVSAAEGFVLLSAFMAGLVYSRAGYREGVDAMRRAFWRRALRIYLAQAATLLFLFTIIAAVGLRIDQPAVKDLMSFYLEQPREGFLFGLLLVYEPPLLDILPMYIFFMLLSPWVLALAMRHGWLGVVLASTTVWALAQFGLSEWIYVGVVRWTGLSVPFHEMGAFNAYAWQFLWFMGLWLGASRSAPGARPIRLPPWLLLAATAVALYGLYWRHHGLNGQAPFGADEQLNLLFDKWQLGPLRILNLVALGVLAIGFGPALARRLPRLHALEAMGSASLPVFCAHLVAVLLVLAFYGSNQLVRPAWGDALLLGVVFAGLYAVARVTLWLDVRKAARLRLRAAD